MAVTRYIVKDVDAAVAFYTQRLGFTLKQQFGPNMAILLRVI
jgi:catechol 2,3-dioxygenase-like lactoylglutathione lyase family enzyme